MARPTDIRGLYGLMDRYCDGDRRAFSDLHAALTPRLRGFLIKLVRDASTADDLLQLTFLKAHLARERFCVQGGDPDGTVRAWYFAIARNVALDHLRQRGRRERHETTLLARGGDRDEIEVEVQLADEGASIEELALQRELGEAIVERVRAAIEQLPASQREVVELHKLQGMSMEH